MTVLILTKSNIPLSVAILAIVMLIFGISIRRIIINLRQGRCTGCGGNCEGCAESRKEGTHQKKCSFSLPEYFPF